MIPLSFEQDCDRSFFVLPRWKLFLALQCISTPLKTAVEILLFQYQMVAARKPAEWLVHFALFEDLTGLKRRYVGSQPYRLPIQ
jgi:hypothetical protein